MEALTDSKDGYARRKRVFVYAWSSRFVDAVRPPGQDDSFELAFGMQRLHFRICALEGYDLGINAEFSNSARNELRILGAEVDDQNHGTPTLFQDPVQNAVQDFARTLLGLS